MEFDPMEDQPKMVSASTEDTLYENTMFPLVFSVIEITNHIFNDKIEMDISPSKNRMTRLQKEVKFIQNNLPIHFNSTIAVRFDESRLHVIKAIIFAPNDTPFDSGCYQFDIYVPPDYPNVPPLVKIVNNGGVRYSPNLYADGKVCLSLLGTWRGQHATENWTSGSSIWQVLISIQSAILGSKFPIYDEPGVTPYSYGIDKYTHKNGGLFPTRELVIKHAIIEQIKNAPKGFKEIVLNHFRIKQQYILLNCYKWIDEATANNMTEHVTTLNNLVCELQQQFIKLQ